MTSMESKDLMLEFNKQMADSVDMKLDHCEEGFSLERLYQIAGKEDRVINVSFRKGSLSERTWGDTVTCCLIYTERERLQLQAKLEKGENNYGKAKAHYLLYQLPKELAEKLENEGFDSRDVEEVLVALI